ncbi:hypothetical protein [Metabacillus idriensis]|uniref:hypothetical protein n=1 Tax=Metabacillus idriensis TaxID=324768 RepID=UPI001CD1D318|nr:hypothetical protein [Metabacillus idriensis]
MKEYAVYKGEDILCIGTIKECAEFMNVLPDTIKFYMTPSYLKRVAKRKKAKNYITVIRLDDDND